MDLCLSRQILDSPGVEGHLHQQEASCAAPDERVCLIFFIKHVRFKCPSSSRPSLGTKKNLEAVPTCLETSPSRKRIHI
eukprot:693306-Pelagomonas_calceolata.AAC.2